MARIEPLPPKEWPPEMKSAMAALRPAEPRHPFPRQDGNRPKGLNALGTFAHHPALTQAFNTFNGHILFATTLSVRQRELIVLRVAALRGSEYEWAQHEVLAADAGISRDEVAAVAKGTGDWSRLEAALLRATDELIADATVTEDTWAVLAAELDTQQLLDFVFTVGAYDTVAMVFGAFAVDLDDDLRRK